MFVSRFLSIAACCVLPGLVSAASLPSLVGGDSLTEGALTFSGFTFSGIGITADQFDLTTSATANTITLITTIDSAVELSDTGFVEYDIDFDVSVNDPGLVLTQIALGSGDLIASGDDAFSEVLVSDSAGPTTLATILADTLNPDVTSDQSNLAALSGLGLEIAGFAETFATGSMASFSTYAVTLTLGDVPPVIPLPAGLPLMLGGLGVFALLRRRPRAH